MKGWVFALAGLFILAAGPAWAHGPTVEITTAGFKPVLLNLFENARLANARHVTATVSHVTSAGRVRIDIADDGSGIEHDVLPKIFEPHFSTRTSGSGLGLAITRRLVESWGGEVAIASEPGVGTTVTVGLVTAS